MMKNLLPTSLKLAAVSLAIGAFTASADTIAPYFETFEETSSSKILPNGWNYYADFRTGYEDYTYSSSPNQGFDGSRCVLFNSQLLEEEYDPWGDWAPKRAPKENMTGYRNAAAVTPAVTGTVTLKVRSRGTSSMYKNEEFLNIYDVIVSNGTASPNTNSRIEYTEVEIEGGQAPEDNPWRLITFDAGETPKRIALVPSNLFVDDFTAETVDIPAIRTMTISGFGAQGATNIYANEQGEVAIPVKFTLKNTGNVTFNPGDENYTVTFLKSSVPMYVWPVNESLAPNETKEFLMDILYTLADPQVDERSAVIRPREDMSNTSAYSTNFNLYGWNCACVTYEEGRDYSIKNFNLGLFSGSKEVNFRILNKGAAPLIISGFDMPEGVSSNLEFPLTIEGGNIVPCTLTFTGEPGALSGTITINSNGFGTDNVTELTYQGAILEDGVYVHDFSDKLIPGNWIAEQDNQWKIYTSGTLGPWLQSPSAADKGKLITEKVSFAEGQKLTIAYAGTSFYGSPYPNLHIYTSPDRQNWTEIKNFVHLDDERTNYVKPANTMAVAEIDMPEGEYYLGFEGVKTYIDYIFGGALAVVDHDLMLTGFNAPANGMVNHPVTASVSFKNYGNATESSDDFTVSLLHGGVVVATAEPQDIVIGDPVTFNFSFIPHYACEERPVQAVIEFEDGYTLSTGESTLAIAEEVLMSDMQVGTIDTSKTTEYVPFRGYDKNSRAIMTYRPEILPIQAGDKIRKLTFLYRNDTDKNYEREIKVWMANGNNQDIAYADTTNMTLVGHVFDNYKKSTDDEKIIEGTFNTMEFTFPESFEYDGTGLQLIARNEAGQWGRTSFARFDDTNASKVNSSDTYSTYKNGSPSVKSELPVIILSLETEAVTINGTVTRNEDGEEPTPLAGAVVRLEGDGLLYSATTDEEGLYSIPLYQNNHEYETSVYACGHLDTLLPAATYEESAEVNIEMLENMVDAETFVNSMGEGNMLLLTWNHVTPGTLDADKEISYEIHVDGVKVAETAENTHTLDMTPYEGAAQHEIGIRARFGEYLTKPVSATVSMTVGVDNVMINSVRIAAERESIIVEAPAAAMIQVIDAAGAAIERRSNGSQNIISVQPGIYFVVVSDGANRIVRKVIVG